MAVQGPVKHPPMDHMLRRGLWEVLQALQTRAKGGGGTELGICFPRGHSAVHKVALPRAAQLDRGGGAARSAARASTALYHVPSPNTRHHHRLPPAQVCIRRGGASKVVSEAVRQAVGGCFQSGWRRLLSVTNAIEAGTWRQGDIGWA